MVVGTHPTTDEETKMKLKALAVSFVFFCLFVPSKKKDIFPRKTLQRRSNKKRTFREFFLDTDINLF